VGHPAGSVVVPDPSSGAGAEEFSDGCPDEGDPVSADGDEGDAGVSDEEAGGHGPAEPSGADAQADGESDDGAGLTDGDGRPAGGSVLRSSSPVSPLCRVNQSPLSGSKITKTSTTWAAGETTTTSEGR
jgi:hypothetical protein